MPSENEDICFGMSWGYTYVVERECSYYLYFKENSSAAVLGWAIKISNTMADDTKKPVVSISLEHQGWLDLRILVSLHIFIFYSFLN